MADFIPVNKRTQSWFGSGVVLLLLAAFVIGSVQDPLSFFRPSVIKVGSKSLSLEEFRGLFFQKYGMVRMLKESGYQIADEVRFVLNEIIKELAVDAEMQQMGISVSDQFAKEYLAENPAFQGSNGQFDEKKFREHLARKGVGFKVFMDMTKRTIAEKRLKDVVLAQVVVPDTMKALVVKGWFQKRIAYYKPFYFEQEKISVLDSGKRDQALKPLFEKTKMKSLEKRTVVILELPQASKGESSEDWLVKVEDELAHRKTLEATAKALSLTCVRKEFVKKQGSDQGFSEDFLQQVFALKPCESAEVVQDHTGKTFFVVVEKVVPESLMTYEQALPQLEKIYIQVQQREKALHAAESYAKNKLASVEGKLKNGKAVGGFIALDPVCMEEGNPQELSVLKEAVMRLKISGHTVVQDEKGCYVVYLAKIQEPDVQTESAEKIEKYALQDLKGRFWQAYVNDLVKKHPHTIDQGALDKFLKELRRD